MNAKKLMECFDNTPSLVALCDSEGIIQAANAALSALAGPGVVSWTGLLSAQSGTELQECIQACLRGDAPFPVNVEIRDVAYQFWVDRLAGCAAAVMVTGHNQALKKQREEHAYVTRSMRSMAELTNRIAHDMNNVLSGALGFSSYLQTKFEKGSDVHKQLALIEASALRGHEITQQLLAFSRRRCEKSGQVPVGELVRQVAADLAKQRDVKIVTKLRNELPPLPGNPDKIKNALTQVVLNACEAQRGQRKSSVHITVECRPLSALERYIFNRMTDVRPYACIIVADHGAGVPEHIAPRVYEPYITTKPIGENSGLGLAVTHSMVEDHEGMLSITRDAETTHARMFLPYREIATETEAKSPASAPSKIQGDETILLIDDEIIIRRLLGDLMPRFGYTALCAESGEEGVKIFAEQKDDIDLILLDLNMPGLNGEETYEALREISAEVPVVIFSGYIAPTIQEKLETLGVAGFIHKPFKNMDLLLQVRGVLDNP
ncbi:MAG: response regulator [Kiritimatiellae bacterium]|nr:response regulator [Kiritimatiellia bacterium]